MDGCSIIQITQVLNIQRVHVDTAKQPHKMHTQLWSNEPQEVADLHHDPIAYTDQSHLHDDCPELPVARAYAVRVHADMEPLE